MIMFMLMNACGIDTCIVINDTHAWNKIKLNGKYYAMDMTWEDKKTGISYAWFNKSDKFIQKYDTVQNHKDQKALLRYGPKQQEITRINKG